MQGSTIGSIVFETNNATSATITSGSLPAGLTASWTSPIFTIKGTVNTGATAKAYTFTVTPITQTGCTNVTATGEIKVRNKVNAPTYAVSTKTWTVASVTYSDRINYAPSNCMKVTVASDQKNKKEYLVKDGVHIYSWNCLQEIKNTICPSPWHIPADDRGVLLQSGLTDAIKADWDPTGQWDINALDHTVCYWTDAVGPTNEYSEAYCVASGNYQGWLAWFMEYYAVRCTNY
jgi:hypothetical protein